MICYEPNVARFVVWFNDLLRALSQFAWPTVAAYFLYRYGDRVGELIPRVREIYGAKFDPQVRQTAEEPPKPSDALRALGAPVDAVAGAAPAVAVPGRLPAIIENARTPPVVELEQLILATPEIAGLGDPQLRIEALATIAGVMFLAAIFERLDASIWASQVRLLETLNAQPQGMPTDQAKAMFFDTAKAAFPHWFTNYSFEQYLHFLGSFALVAVTAETVTITERGREYLIWRVRQGKAPRLFA